MVLLSVEVAHGIWRDVVEVPDDDLQEIPQPDCETTYLIAEGSTANWIDRMAALRLPRGPATWRITRRHQDGSTSVTVKRLETRARGTDPCLELFSH